VKSDGKSLHASRFTLHILPLPCYNNLMGHFFEEFIKNRPARLCKRCGRCCKTSTTSVPYEELLKLKEQGNESAADFLNVFEPYPSIEAAREDSPDVVDNIVSYINNPSDMEKLTFYRCKHLLENNLCEKYEARPELCDAFPASPWAVIPPECGYEGWLFQEKEKIKQNIRKQKEILLQLKILLKTVKEEEDLNKINANIEKIEKNIKKYSKYGSANW
jgi:Fe-S-cluster containining protein